MYHNRLHLNTAPLSYLSKGLETVRKETALPGPERGKDLLQFVLRSRPRAYDAPFRACPASRTPESTVSPEREIV